MKRTPLVELPAVLAQPQAQGEARYLLGVDGGATKTLAAVLDLDTGAVHLGHGGPSNEDAVGAEAAVAALLGAADEAIGDAGIVPAQLGAAVLAVAGTDTAAIAEHVRAARTDAWMVVNDVVGAWATATGAGPGVAVISGTGSNVFGVGHDGRAWRAGGWGHLLGRRGLRLLAGGAVDQGRPARPRGLRPADRAQRCRCPSSSTRRASRRSPTSSTPSR